MDNKWLPENTGEEDRAILGHTSLQVSFLQTKPPTPCLTAMSGIPKFAGRVKKKTMRLDVRI
jgi:hypothetical protein